ncbi:hypothetical protein [Streptomyces sp. NPDC002845]
MGHRRGRWRTSEPDMVWVAGGEPRGQAVVEEVRSSSPQDAEQIMTQLARTAGAEGPTEWNL